jgi:hypothetical protein
LLRVVDLDPHEVGVDSALWTCRLLADYLAEVTVSEARERPAHRPRPTQARS